MVIVGGQVSHVCQERSEERVEGERVEGESKLDLQVFQSWEKKRDRRIFQNHAEMYKNESKYAEI